MCTFLFIFKCEWLIKSLNFNLIFEWYICWCISFVDYVIDIICYAMIQKINFLILSSRCFRIFIVISMLSYIIVQWRLLRFFVIIFFAMWRCINLMIFKIALYSKLMSIWYFNFKIRILMSWAWNCKTNCIDQLMHVYDLYVKHMIANIMIKRRVKSSRCDCFRTKIIIAWKAFNKKKHLIEEFFRQRFVNFYI